MKANTQHSYHERILKVLLHIEQYSDQELRLEELAKVACFSPYHFHRIFKGMTGKTIGQYIRRIRLDKAALQLRYTKTSVTDMAFNSGYDTVESFIRAFKKRFTLSPSQYRKADSAGSTSMDHAEYLRQIQKGDIMIDVTLKELTSRKVLFVRHTGPYDQCKTAWEKVCGFAGSKGLMPAVTEFCGLCYDNPEETAPEDIRYDACLVTEADITAEGEIGTQKIPGGKYATCQHKGPYSGLAQTYQEIYGHWLPQSGHEPKHSPSIEVYLNSPEDVPEQDLLTEIQIPLA